MKKIIITDRQLGLITNHINEGNTHSNLVKRIKEELDANYSPINKFVREGGEYFDKPMIMVKVDEEVITPKALYEYIKSKYKTGDNFTKQVIRDWVSGSISDDFRLSKNVGLDYGPKD